MLQAISPGAPVDVTQGGDFQIQTEYGTHPSSESHTVGAIRAKIVLVSGRALAFKRSSVSDIPGLRVSPLSAVEGRKLRIIYDLMFAGMGIVRM